jgi:plastocyanin
MLRTKRTLLLAAAAVPVLIFAGLATAAAVTINLTATGPQPATVTMTLGDTVTFFNADTVKHALSAPRLGVRSPDLAPGASFSHVLVRSGAVRVRQVRTRRAVGTIIVKKPARLTLAAPRTPIRFGSSASLTGRTPLPAFPITVFRREVGQQEWSELGQTTAQPDGRFTFTIQPSLETNYRAAALGNELVASTTAHVAPRVSLAVSPRRARTGTAISIRVRVIPANAARHVTVLYFNREQKDWRRIETRPLARGRALVRWEIVPGATRLQAKTRKRTTRGGLESASSATVVVTGVGR